MHLTKNELRHYSRHILLEEIGVMGQEKLKKAKVLVIGAGGLGCSIATYLGAAGVGRLGIIDFDKVNISNLHRQLAFRQSDVGHYKATLLKERIQSNNPYVKVATYLSRFSINNAAELVGEYDLIIDGCDNFATRYLSNDATFFAKKPLIFGAIHKFQGQAAIFNHADGPCYRCLFPEPPEATAIPNCAEAGVLGVLPGIIGVIQATEAIKVILGVKETLNGRFLTYDALAMKFAEFKLDKNPSCPICGESPSIKTLAESSIACSSLKNKAMENSQISPQELAEMIKNSVDVRIIDIREEYERKVCCIKGSEHIPLDMLTDSSKIFPVDKKIVLYCHHGQRSLRACKLMRQDGKVNFLSLAGGINRWASEIEPNMAQY